MSRIETLRKRQLLAHLNTCGTANVKQISEALALNRSTVRIYLKALAADKAVRQSTQIEGKAATLYYTALVLILADEPEAPLARIVNKGTERRHPLPNHGGQGAVRRAFGIQSVMG